MKLSHFIYLCASVAFGAFLGQLEVVQSPLMQALMPEIKYETIKLTGTLDDYFSDEAILDSAIDLWYESLSDTAKAGQLIMPEHNQKDPYLYELIRDEIIGGYMILGKNFSPVDAHDMRNFNNTPVPLLVAIDAEPSLLKYRFENPNFTSETLTLNTAEKINTVSKSIGKMIRDLGANLNFAPVYDLGINQSVIGPRAFSDNPDEVIQRANQMANVFKAQNIIPTAKHFPGHGTVLEDTHLESATITGELSELNQFEAAIANQIPVMMVGHLAVNTPEYDTNGQPATVSSLIMQDLLREKLEFEGLIITDAMNMAAVADIKDKDLKALLAGADIVLMPDNPIALNQQLVKILEQEPMKLENKIKRVLRLKLAWKLGKTK